MINQHQISNLQIQPQAVSSSDISLSKNTCVNICLRPLKITTNLPYGIDTHT